MLDSRVYRAAFLPAFLMLFVAAFSLQNRPAPVGTDLAPEAFSAARAFGQGPAEPPRNSLLELASSFADRAPGSAGDRALADRVAGELAEDGRFGVRRTTHAADVGGRRAQLETVVGVRPGVSSRRIVVLAHRDARGRGAAAELSGTAVLLELARIADLRDLQRTLVMVSTSGGTAGAAGARAWAKSLGDPAAVDAVLVLGDLAGRRSESPWVIPWSNDADPAPIALRRTVEAAVRAEAAEDPGSTRALVQWVRRALPFAPGEQGELLAEGVPAVTLQVSGEAGPAPSEPVSAERLGAMGRSALRAITALDEARVRRTGSGEEVSALVAGPDGLVTLRKVLPIWAVRLTVLALLAPAILLAADAWVRQRARGVPLARWLAWAAAGAVPLLIAWAWLRTLDLTGLLDAPRGATTANELSLGAGGVAAMASAVAVAAGAAFGLRRIVGRATGATGNPAASGGTTAVGTLACLLCAVLAFTDPFAAALVLPAAHLWLLGPLSARRGWLVVAAAVGGVLLPVAAVLVYGGELDMGPLGLAWTFTLAVAGGALELGTALALTLYAGAVLRMPAVVAGRLRLGGGRFMDPRRLPADVAAAPLRPVDGAGSALRNR